MIRLAIRGYIGRTQQFEDRIDVPYDDAEIDQIMQRVGFDHALRLLDLPGGDKHMIEIEFLDEPDPQTRFFRFGTDPSLMVDPLEVER